MPSACRLVTPCSRMPQGTIPSKCRNSGATLSDTPCQLTQRVRRTPRAAILHSRPVAGSATHTPMRPSRSSPATPKSAQRADQPGFQRRHEATDIARRHRAVPALQVQYHIGDALARAVIGPLATAPRLVGRKAERVEQVAGLRRGAGGEQGGMLQQPDPLGPRCRRGLPRHATASPRWPRDRQRRAGWSARAGRRRPRHDSPSLPRDRASVIRASVSRYRASGPRCHGAVVAEW